MLAASWSPEQWLLVIAGVTAAVAAAVVSVIQALHSTSAHTETTTKLDDIHVLVNDRLEAALTKIAALEQASKRGAKR